MTSVISRLYEDTASAEAVVAELHSAGFPADAVDMIKQTGDASVVDQVMAARVSSGLAQAVAQHMSAGRALVVARAPFQPIGAAQRAKDIMNGYPHVHQGMPSGDEYIREEPRRDLRISAWQGSPRFFSQDIQPGSGRPRMSFSQAFGMRTLSKRKERNSVYSGGKQIIPMNLLSKKERKNSVISGSGLFLSRIIGWTPITRREG